MESQTFDIDGPLEIIPRKIEDERGYFSEIFRLDTFAERAPGMEFVQDNQSLSVRTGTIRGIHFQTHPAAQGKLVRCLAGSLFDVAVDLRCGFCRPSGAGYRQVLSPEQNNQLWVPVGFGHAFCTLRAEHRRQLPSDELLQLRSMIRGSAWDDPDIGVDWPDVADARDVFRQGSRAAEAGRSAWLFLR